MMIERLKRLTLKLFIWGIGLLLLVGAVIAFVYIVLFFIGSTAAVRIESFIRETIFPILFVLNIFLCVIGIIYVYLIKDKGFRFNVGQKTSEQKHKV